MFATNTDLSTPTSAPVRHSAMASTEGKKLMSNEEHKARELIERIAREKRQRLDAGGPDFRGSLKRLVAIWSDPSQALIELLQNADDAGASNVEYGLSEEGIILRHDGTLFTEENIWAICSVDRSTKDPETHTGFMGIGFKAVFRLSDAPHVFSGAYRFQFAPDGLGRDDWGWILVPSWLETIPPQAKTVGGDGTVFWLPYKSELKEGNRKRVERAILDQFDSLSLMFLRNVRGIFVTKGDSRVRELLRQGNIVLETVRGHKDVQHQYKLFGGGADGLFQVPEEARSEYRVQESERDKVKVRRVELAFSLDDDGNLRPLKDAKLYVFLPTNYSTGLRFAVQSDFIFDTARITIDETLEWNRWLWRCAGKLLQGAVESFKTADKHRHQFYRALPVRQDDFPDIVKEEFVEPFWEWCRQSAIIITSSGEWVKPTEAVLATPAVQELLDADKLEAVVGRRHFVHAEVQEAKTFLTGVGVVELEESQVLKVLEDQEWVQEHNGEWFTRLYRFLWEGLYGDPPGWKDWWKYYKDDEVKKLPVVRTTQGTVKPASKVLFAPQAAADAEMARGIPGIVFADEQVLDGEGRKLLQEWGVREFEAESVVRLILRSFHSGEWQSWSSAEYNRCLEFLRTWLRAREWQAPPELKLRLGAVHVRVQTGEMRRADECYFRTDPMARLCPDGPFAIYDDAEEQQFLEALGVTGRLRIREVQGYYRRWEGPDWVPKWRDYFHWFHQEAPEKSWNTVVEIEGAPVLAQAFFDSPDAEAAVYVLEQLLQHWDSYYARYTDASYKWRYNKSNSTWRWNRMLPNYSYFAWQLLEMAWLPTTSGLKRPSAEVFVPSRKVKEVAGDLATYVHVPDGWDANALVQQGKTLFEFLGLRDEVDVEAASYLLEVAQAYPINDSLRDHLSRLYRHIGWLLADMSQEQPEFSDVALLTKRGEFRPADELVWNDDPAIGRHFTGSLDFVWAPDSVERYYLESFFRAARVKRLSTCVQRQLVASSDEIPDDKEQTKRFLDRANYLWSLFVHHRATRADDAKQQLRHAKVCVKPRIEVQLQLGEVATAVLCPSFLNNNPPVLLQTPSASSFEIASELCRAFGLSFDCVSNVESVLRENDLEHIELRFQQQGIPLVDWDRRPLDPLTPKKGNGEGDEEEEKEEDENGERNGEEDENEEGNGDGNGGPGPEPPPPPPGPTVPFEELMRIEHTNIERIIRFEEREGRRAQDVSKENRGYDIESIGEEEERHIEVKSSSYVCLTQNELETAQREDGIYWLYVVDGVKLHMIRDSANKCQMEEMEIYQIRWKIDGWREQSEVASLPSL